MQLKLGYYPFLDVLLALRQLYSVERFQPYTASLQAIDGKLSESERAFIHDFGENSTGWLDTISDYIGKTLEGMVSPEEILLSLKNQHPEFLALWQNYFNNEISRWNQQVFERLMEFSGQIQAKGAVDYILGFTDRVECEDEHTLRFNIKPVHKVDARSIKNLIIMPSIFASRNFTFWYGGDDYLFFLSVHAFSQPHEEPTDNMLLKTLALNDRTRLKMLRILSSGSFSATDMAEKLSINASTASRHFKVFKDAGFVDIISQDGNTIYYSLNRDEINRSFDLIMKYIKSEV